MDISKENVEEDSKYAFLLGSALKNEDPEQLLTVYDKLIPKDISDSRLEKIKEEARTISELPEYEFNALVLSARTFSLAPGRSSMSQVSGRSSVPLSDDKRDEVVSHPSRQDRLDSKHLIHTHAIHSLPNSFPNKVHPNPPDSLNVKIGLDLHGASADEDSGFPDSSLKTSVSLKNSVSGSENFDGEDSEEERPGSFDYMPRQSQTNHVRITHTLNPPYDEEVKVDSSTGGSSIESPRSETSATYDEYNLHGEEGTEMEMINYKETPHEVLYGKSRGRTNENKHHEGNCWDYTGSRQDEDKDHGAYNRPQPSHTPPSPSTFGRSFQSHSEIDSQISFGLERRQVMASSYNMNPTRGGVSDGNKEKKDRKKSRSVDDSPKRDVDVNGNPLHVDLSSYPQMRLSQSSKSESSPAGSLANNASQSGNEQTDLARRMQRKRMKLERQKGTLSDTYKDFKGDRPLEDILSYIEGGNSSKKQGRDSSSSTDPSKTEAKSARKKPERGQKKDQPLNGPIHSHEENSTSEEAPSTGKNAAVVTSVVKSSPVAMGNSSVKTLGENNIFSTSTATEEDFDKSSNEFHDCVNTLPAEHGNLIKEQQTNSKLNCNNKKIAANSVTDSDKLDISLKTENNFDKSSVVNNNKSSSAKKQSKPKNSTKKDKQESIDSNGPLSPKVSMVKPKEIAEPQDTLPPVSKDPSMDLDLDPDMNSELRREESFTEVKKKKKRNGAKDFNNGLNSSSNFSGPFYPRGNNGSSYRNNTRPRPTTPPPSQTTTVAVSNHTTLPVSEPNHASRDLSPSSFPVLSGHGSTAPHTEERGRRNSCGDINTDSMDSKTYDSDRESVKSLPAARAVRAGGETSPIYPVTYATMVAAPRKSDNTNSPSSESGVASGSQNSSVNSSITHTPGSSIDVTSPQPTPNQAVTPDRKTTVWKGSPRERRHSIGSSPEDKVEGEKSSLGQRNRQKSGSQEILNRELLAASKTGASSSSQAPIKVIHASESSSSLQSDIDTQDKTASQPSDKVIPSQPTVMSSTLTAGKLQGKSSTPVPSSALSPNASTAIANSSSSGGPVTMPSQMPAQQPSQLSGVKESTEPEPTANLVPALGPNRAKKSIPPQAATVLTPSTAPGDPCSKTSSVSGRNKLVSPGPDPARKPSGSTNNTKSVIFLDRRVDATPPQNFGITFGFDSSIDSTSEPASQSAGQTTQPTTTSPSSSQSTKAIPAVPSTSLPTPPLQSLTTVSQTSQQQLQLSAAEQGHSHIPRSAASVAASSPNSSVSSSPSSRSSDNDNSGKKVPKGPHIQGQRNGLILPQSRAADSASQQVVVASSSVSSSSSIASSERTSSSMVKQGTSSSTKPSQSVVKQNSPAATGQVHPSPASKANNSLGQASKTPVHVVKDNNILSMANPAGVTFSLNHPPPPLPQGTVVVSTGGINNTSFFSLTTPHQETCNIKMEGQKILKTTEANKAVPHQPASSKTPQTSSDTTSTAGKPNQASATAQSSSSELKNSASAISVVYGSLLKHEGCGKVMFVPPPNMSKKKSKANSAEASNFLKKKWAEMCEKQRKTPSSFITILDD